MGDSRQMTDLELIQAQMHQKTDESLASTQRMVKYAVEAQDAGLKTMANLDAQGEQLQNVEEGLDQINRDMDDAEKNLRDLNKCCGLCVLPWNRIKKFDNPKGNWNASNETASSNTNKQNQNYKVEMSRTSGANGGQYITRITNDAREEEMEKNVQEVHDIVGNLKTMAVDMGAEVDKQNKMLGRIQEKVEYSDARIGHANIEATKIVNK